MAKFYGPYIGMPEKHANDPGNCIEPTYSERYDDKGVPYLEKTGEINTYERIQSYRDECDINSILTRYANGDQTVLQRPGYYLDTTVLPQNIIDATNMINEQKAKFAALPIEVRNKFNQSFEQWAATAGSDEWAKKMGLEKQPEVQPSVTTGPEVMANES